MSLSAWEGSIYEKECRNIQQFLFSGFSKDLFTANRQLL